MSLAAFKARWSAYVDAQAEAARLAWITPGAGQAAVYLLKREQAKSWLAAVDPDPAAYPLLAAEVGLTAETMTGVAMIIAGIADAWEATAAEIETIRLGAKRAIADAESEGAILAAAQVVFPKPSTET